LGISFNWLNVGEREVFKYSFELLTSLHENNSLFFMFSFDSEMKSKSYHICSVGTFICLNIIDQFYVQKRDGSIFCHWFGMFRSDCFYFCDFANRSKKSSLANNCLCVDISSKQIESFDWRYIMEINQKCSFFNLSNLISIV
jgi:hypothetical protein